jgi:predicted dinucleotide-utilizing enzyme
LAAHPDSGNPDAREFWLSVFVEISTSIRSITLRSNPKTSVLAPFSLLQTIKKRTGLILA